MYLTIKVDTFYCSDKQNAIPLQRQNNKVKPN